MIIYDRPRLLADDITVDKEIDSITVRGTRVLEVNKDCDYVISSVDLPYSNGEFVSYDKIVVALVKINPKERIGNNEQRGEV